MNIIAHFYVSPVKSKIPVVGSIRNAPWDMWTEPKGVEAALYTIDCSGKTLTLAPLPALSTLTRGPRLGTALRVSASKSLGNT